MQEFLIIKLKKKKVRNQIHSFRLIQRLMCPPILQELFLKELHHMVLLLVHLMDCEDQHIQSLKNLFVVRNNGLIMLTTLMTGVITKLVGLTLEFHTCLHLRNQMMKKMTRKRMIQRRRFHKDLHHTVSHHHQQLVKRVKRKTPRLKVLLLQHYLLHHLS